MKYEKNPKKILEQSLQYVEDGTDTKHLSASEKLIAMKMLMANGDLSILENIQFSPNVIEKTMETLDDDFDLLCDSETVACGIKQKYLNNEPICLINKASVISQAKSSKYTRSMVAVDLWKTYLSGSIIIIGTEATALFRLLELLTEESNLENPAKPALIIATPAGFTGAKKSKKLLWEMHEELDIPCIVVQGTQGGSDLATTAINTLLKMSKAAQTTSD